MSNMSEAANCDENYANQIVEGLLKSNLLSSTDFNFGSLSPITGKSNDFAPNKKKPKLTVPVEGNADLDSSFFEGYNFEEKRKIKVLQVNQTPDASPLYSTKSWNEVNSPVDNEDFVSIGEALDFNLNGPFISQETLSEGTLSEGDFYNFLFKESLTDQSTLLVPNREDALNEKSEECNTENHQSSQVSGNITEPSVGGLLDAIMGTSSVDKSNTGGQSTSGSEAVAIYSGSSNQETGQYLSLLPAHASTSLPVLINGNDFLEIHDLACLKTPENEQVFVPRSLLSCDNAEKELKTKPLLAYIALMGLQKTATTLLNKLAAGSVQDQEIAISCKSQAEKLQKLAQHCTPLPLEVALAGEIRKELPPVSPRQVVQETTADTHLEIEGFTIKRSAWAAAYAHIDIKNSAVDLFEDLYTDEEKSTATISGRICVKEDGTKEKTPRLDPERLNVINHAIASMMKKKHTYYYNPNDFKDLKKADFNSIKGGLSQRLNQIKQAKKKSA